MAFRGFKTGTYVPTAGKCIHTKVAKYRSSYEHAFCLLLDQAPKVVHWEYERYYIGYWFRGKYHHYLTDFNIELDTGEKFVIEIKPKAFYERALLNKDKNYHKWEAAISFCRNHGMQFKVITEVSIPVLRKAWLGK